MEFPELSLAPTTHCVDDINSTTNSCKKRKLIYSDHHHDHHASLDLQFKNPLPPDWEQCLDLESGRMYYLNRKTASKSWRWPKDQKLDLELNISSCDLSEKSSNNNRNSGWLGDGENKKKQNYSSSSGMIALACLNCHLLVILSKSSPTCPNCKFLHSLPLFQQNPSPKIPGNAKSSLSTLSLLN